MRLRTRLGSLVLTLLVTAAFGASACAEKADSREDANKDKPTPSGKADVLRRVPKEFGTLVDVRPDAGRVTLRSGKDAEPKSWPVDADAALRVDAGWGRLEQFTPGDRVWAWFAVDRQERPRSILLLADEISEQDLHGRPYTLQAADAEGQTLTVTRTLGGMKKKDKSAGETRVLSLAENLRVSGRQDGFRLRSGNEDSLGGTTSVDLEPGAEVFVQTAGKRLRRLIPAATLSGVRERQRKRMHAFWKEHGLPGTVTFLHPLAGEMELTLDHAAIRWGRALETGDKVTLAAGEPIEATVKHVAPWRERTRLRLVTASGLDQAELSLGQRLRLRVLDPPAEFFASRLPTGLGRDRTKAQRIEWLLSSIYCSCRIGGERCTGMFYTLAGCNANACPMVATQRERIAELIERGKTDREILETLRESHGAELLKPHLLK